MGSLLNRERVCAYVISHPRLTFENTDQLSLSFIEKRLQSLLPEYDFKFVLLSGGIESLRTNAESPDQLAVVLSLMNPLLDHELLRVLLQFVRDEGCNITSSGHVPGSAPVVVGTIGSIVNGTEQAAQKLWNTQRLYNSQLNLYRLKRVKIFRSFLKKFSDFHSWSLHRLFEFTSSREGTAFVLAYGEDVALEPRNVCPLCQSRRIAELHADNGQPVLGFLTRHSVYYYQCETCSLVFQSPQMPEAELWRYYDRYAYESTFETEDLASRLCQLNEENTSHLANYQAVEKELKALPKKGVALDLGGGRGEFCAYLQNLRPDLQIELHDFRIDAETAAVLNGFNIKTREGNFVRAHDIAQASVDLITTWEVIEHLPAERLSDFFARVSFQLREGGLYILSTPDFMSSYAHALDFWAMAPGEHLTVLSRRVLEPLLQKADLHIVSEYHESVTMKVANRWFKYGMEAHASLAARGEACIVNDFLSNTEGLSAHREYLRKNNAGSELILVARKGKANP